MHFGDSGHPEPSPGGHFFPNGHYIRLGRGGGGGEGGEGGGEGGEGLWEGKMIDMYNTLEEEAKLYI